MPSLRQRIDTMKKQTQLAVLGLVIVVLLISFVTAAKTPSINEDDIIVEQPRVIISNQDVIEGNLIYHDSEDGYLQVRPHTVTNPQLQWQYITITTKRADKFKFMADFYDELEWLVIEEWKIEPQPYTYCYDEVSANCETKYIEYESWVDVTWQYVKEKSNGNDKFKTNKFYDMKKDDTKELRIKYKPTAPSGKWDLVLVDDENKKTTVDPWYNIKDQNVTQGFVYLTNVSKTITFGDYDFIVLENFDSVTSLVISHDYQDLQTTTNNTEGINAVKAFVNITRSPDEYGRIYRQDYIGVNLSKYNTFSFWHYTAGKINTSHSISNYSLRIAMYDNATSQGNVYLTNPVLKDGWNQINIPFSSYTSNFTNWTGFRIYAYDDNKTGLIEVRYDDMIAYNSNNYYDNDFNFTWGTDKDNTVWGLQYRDNGYGFNKTMLAIGRTDSNMYPTHTFSEDFSGGDFEMIAILPKDKLDFGNDICALSMGLNTLKQAVWWVGQGVFYFYRPDGTKVIYNWVDTISPDNNFYIKFQSINDIHYWYYSNNTGVNWTLGLNYTEVYETDKIGFRVANGVCYVHSLIFRELIPQYNPAGDYHASYMYQSSNVTEWSQSRNWYYKDGVLQGVVDKEFNPTDAEIPLHDYAMTAGVWYGEVRVYDDESNYATNDTQTIYIALGSFNITIHDEVTQAIITNQTVYLELYSDTYAQNYSTTTGTQQITNIPDGLYEIRYYSSGYDVRSYYSTIALGTTGDIDLFLLNSTVATLVIHTLLDQSSNPAPNLRILLQRNYISGDVSVFKTVQMAQTNFEGKGILYVQLYDVWYKMIYTNSDGVVLGVTDVSPFIDLESQDIVQLGSDFYEGWRRFNDAYYNLSWVTINENSSYARFIYADTTGIVREGCLDVHRLSGQEYTQICHNCTVSASATISCIADTTQTGTLKAVATIDTTTENSWETVAAKLLSYKSDAGLGQEGIFHGALIVGTMGLMGAATITGSIVLLLVAVIGITVTSFLTGFTIGWIYYLAIMGLIIIYMIRRGSR